MSAPRRPMPGPMAEPPPGPPAEIAPAPDPDPPLSFPLVVLGVVALVLVAAFGAVVSVLLTPTRIGTTLVPIAVVVAVVLNVVVPILTVRISGSRAIGALPVLVFFVVGWAMSISPGGDVLLAGGSGGQTAISYATLLLPVLAGSVTSVRARPSVVSADPSGTGSRGGASSPR